MANGKYNLNNKKELIFKMDPTINPKIQTNGDIRPKWFRWRRYTLHTDIENSSLGEWHNYLHLNMAFWINFIKFTF